MKCTLAHFEDVNVKGHPYDAPYDTTERIPVECGGEIKMHKEEYRGGGYKPRGFYCTKCGVRYEKLPEEKDE